MEGDREARIQVDPYKKSLYKKPEFTCRAITVQILCLSLSLHWFNRTEGESIDDDFNEDVTFFEFRTS